MTDRDRLIELISREQDYGVTYTRSQMDDRKVYTNETPNSALADHILADGWMRPPVKVGDKVYKITRNKVKECEVVFVGISADERCSHFNFVENYADGTFYKSYSMVFDVIDKTVFLTKEEAEAKLEELNTNGR